MLCTTTLSPQGRTCSDDPASLYPAGAAKTGTDPLLAGAVTQTVILPGLNTAAACSAASAILLSDEAAQRKPALLLATYTCFLDVPAPAEAIYAKADT